MNKTKKISLIILLIICYVALSASAFAQETKPKSLFGGICNPKALPNESNACTPAKFLELLRNVINFMLVLIIPLAVGFIIYGGFVIMTAAGSEEKIKLGRKIITVAVIGVTIAFGSWLIITTVQKIIGVKQVIQ